MHSDRTRTLSAERINLKFQNNLEFNFFRISFVAIASFSFYVFNKSRAAISEVLKYMNVVAWCGISLRCAAMWAVAAIEERKSSIYPAPVNFADLMTYATSKFVCDDVRFGTIRLQLSDGCNFFGSSLVINHNSQWKYVFFFSQWIDKI